MLFCVHFGHVRICNQLLCKQVIFKVFTVLKSQTRLKKRSAHLSLWLADKDIIIVSSISQQPYSYSEEGKSFKTEVQTLFHKMYGLLPNPVCPIVSTMCNIFEFLISI